MQNLKLLAVKLGDSLKNVTTINELERIGSSVFPFPRTEHVHSESSYMRSFVGRGFSRDIRERVQRGFSPWLL
jgi:hypothetical protein